MVCAALQSCPARIGRNLPLCRLTGIGYFQLMELNVVMERFIEGITYIDRNDGQLRTNQRTKVPYLPGLPLIPEADLTHLFARWWRERYPDDFNPTGCLDTEVAYPDTPRNSCDLVFSTDGNASLPEWAIELKKPVLIGDNGKNNDYSIGKMLSPFLKDRSLIHDIERLGREPIARRKAVLGFMFTYSFQTCDIANQMHPDEVSRIHQLRKVCRLNDPVNGELNPAELINGADVLLRAQGLVEPLLTMPFSGLWRHPCGGNGIAFAWEVTSRAGL